MSDAVARTHLFSYRHEGADWLLEIKATSEADARARIAQLCWAHYDGVLVSKSPAVLSPWTPLECWLRNTLGRVFRRGL
jgi:hypothetical protein